MTHSRNVPAVGLVLSLIVAWGVVATADDELARQLPRIPPTEPADALKTLKVHPGFRVELVASEPLTADPVSACFDADGRLYVVEMRGYPFPEKEPTGVVRLLEDTDDDGRFDKGTAFLSGLNWPTGVLPYDGGVFICAAPDLIYAKDTDGDGVADVRKFMFTGFGTQNVQQLLNGLCWGLDGWVYGAAAGNGGEIKNLKRPQARPVSVRGRDFRFRPDGSAFEAISGGGQFGHVFDDWGRRFVCNNRWHARQIVLPARYLERHPEVTVAGVIADIAADGNEAPVYRISPPEPWRVVRSKQYEAKMKTDPVFARRLPNAERHPAGFFSSASGLTLYRGSTFGPGYRGNVFVCDVAGNLVHRKILTPAGSIFRAERAEPEVKAEFLASTDTWFRPVNLVNTPDGTLLVLDMYRETIEHPLSIPDDIKAHLDLTSGKDRGRIYRIVPAGVGSRPSFRRPSPRLSQASTEALLDCLNDPQNAWLRETAHRLLRERGGRGALPSLVSTARSGLNPLVRLHALWLLENLNESDDEALLAALRDPVPGVRENAARLAEPRLSDPRYRAGLLRLASDPDAMVRFQSALSMSFLDDRQVVPALAAIAARDASDKWTRTAVLLGSRGRTLELVNALAETRKFFGSETGRVWLEELAAVIGVGKDPKPSVELFERFTEPDADPGQARAVVLGLGRSFQRSGRRPEGLFAGETAARLAPLLEKAAVRAGSFSRPVPDRVEAIRLLALGPAETALKALPDLLDASEPPEVQVEAVRVLGGLSDPRVGKVVVDRWRSLSPSVRREAAEVLLARPDRAARLLDAIESRALAPGDLDPLRRKQLLEHPRRELRDRAARLMTNTGGSESDRAEVIRSYRKAAELEGDRGRGHAVYRKICATCHRAGGEGVEVGPGLETVAAKPPDDLIIQILDPNREVAPGFVNYTVATSDGWVVSGMIAEETGASLTLKRAEGVTEVVPRARVEAVTATGLSLMPEGLEKGLSPQDLADLVAFLRGLAPQGP
jgi:putative membrane-bound dehydrogenase-like protein